MNGGFRAQRGRHAGPSRAAGDSPKADCVAEIVPPSLPAPNFHQPATCPRQAGDGAEVATTTGPFGPTGGPTKDSDEQAKRSERTTGVRTEAEAGHVQDVRALQVGHYRGEGRVRRHVGQRDKLPVLHRWLCGQEGRPLQTPRVQNRSIVTNPHGGPP